MIQVKEVLSALHFSLVKYLLFMTTRSGGGGGGDRILKDANDNMADHLQNHIHLTNCIHLKNHLLKHTPFDDSILQTRPPLGSECTRLSASSNDVRNRRERSVNVKGAKKQKRPRFRPAAEFDDHNAITNPRHRCGIPWNWPRIQIHHKGKSFLDMAGRSLSRGRESSISDRPNISDNSSSSSVFGREAFPLLLDASGSHGSTDHRDNSTPFTQKYMPRTFNDLVGQNLVAQALSNAVSKRRIALLYVFHGPHGAGKTACARIFAAALNCQSSDISKPCGSCDSCIAYETGKSRSMREIGPVSNIGYERVLEIFENCIAASKKLSQYAVFIFDECETMASDCWRAIMKAIYRAPRRVAIILVCTSLDALPHVVVSRCQKFLFAKLKDADIVCTLQQIASREDVEIDDDALSLIASRSDGSLRDAEMTLEQLSLLGQRVSLCLVQELIGLISNDKLLDLLDFALSADTVNTVRNLRDITASGVEPLALMSQLATLITEILAGSYDSVKERPMRKFFQMQDLSKEDMEKLRQALKTLSEAEKQLRVSSERMTCLTAALLQLAPDQHYTNTNTNPDPDPSADTTTTTSTSSDHSPIVLDDSALRLRSRKISADERNTCVEQDASKMNEIWFQVLENIKIKSLKEFMHKEGKMITLSYGPAPTVQLLFNSQLTKSVVENSRSRILQAFEAVLRSPVTIEIRQGSSGSILLRNTSHDDEGDEIVEVEADSGEMYSCRMFDEGDLNERQNSLSIVRRKVSLGHVILHADGCSENGGLCRRGAVSIADKLEQENLRLEPSSRRLLCWNPPRISRHTLSCLKIRRKPQTLGKFVSCGRCLSTRCK